MALRYESGTIIEEGKVYTKEEVEGILFETSSNASGQTDLELTIREGVEISSAAGQILTSEEVGEKELEILGDLNQDGVTGIELTQEVYNPNSSHSTSNSSTLPSDSTSDNPETTPTGSTTDESIAPAPAPVPAPTHNHSNKRYAYKSENDGLVITRNQIIGLNLNSIYASDDGEIEHEGPDV